MLYRAVGRLSSVHPQASVVDINRCLIAYHHCTLKRVVLPTEEPLCVTIEGMRPRDSFQDWESLKLAALALMTRGDMALLLESEQQARAFWLSSHEMLDLPTEVTRDPEILDLQANLMQRLGRTVDALHAKHQLERMGYISLYPAEVAILAESHRR